MRKIPSAFLAALLLIAALSVGSLFAAPGGGANWLSLGTAVSSNPFALGTPGLYSKSSDGKPRLVSVAGTEYVAGVAHDIRVYAGTPSGIATGSCWMDSTQSSRLVCREAAGNILQRFDPATPGTFGCGGTPAAGCFTDLTTTGNVQLGDAAADVVTNKGTLRLHNAANTFYVSLTNAATANRAVTFPDAAGAIVLDTATQTLSNKTLASAALSGTTSGAGLIAKANGGTAVDNSTGIAQYAFWGGPSSGAGAATYRTLVAGDLNTATSNTRTTGGGLAALGAATVYLTAPGQNASATEIPLSMSTRSGVARSLYCYLGTAPGGADTVIVTVRKNASDQATTCTITGAGQTCNDTTNTFTTAAGDRLAIKAVSSAGTAAALSCSFEETPG